LEAPQRVPRFVLLNGALTPVPMNPLAFLASSLVGLATKWSILRDGFGKTVPPKEDECIAAFVRRKFSAELLEKLVGPFVSGIYAGDPEKLSLRAAFPQLHQAEAQAGSVVRGSIRAAKKDRPPGEQSSRTPQSFRDGNETLNRVLGEKLGGALHFGAPVIGLRSLLGSSGGPGAFTLTVRMESDEHTFEAQNVILALPTPAAAGLLAGIAPDLSAALAGVEYAPVAVVSLGYRRSDVGHDLEGFGFLAPRSAGLQTLGSVWNSSLFPGRAPEGQVLVTSFVGGATNPGAVALGAEALAGLVHRELAPILRLAQEPTFSHVTAYERAIPQYNLGHTERVQALAKAQERFPGLYLTGNYFSGPAIGACVEHAHAVAARVAADLKP